MANNIYIGNRYVPVFANPVEWDNLREYEPLTIVTYQGTAYTSRKTVPVGTALSNTEYWVVTGNYNAQVEQYRQEVSALDDRVDIAESDIDNLQSRVSVLEDDILITIGDSYLGGYTHEGTLSENWGTVLAGCLGVSASNHKSSNAGGEGLAGGGFTTLLTNVVNSLTADEKKKVKWVVVGGSYNDAGDSIGDVSAGLAGVKSACASLPNATLYAVPFGWQVKALIPSAYDLNHTDAEVINAILNWFNACASQRVKTCDEVYTVMLNNSSLSADYYHPSLYGQRMIGWAIYQQMCGNGIPRIPGYNQYFQNLTPSGGTLSGGNQFTHFVNGKLTELRCHYGNIVYAPSTPFDVTFHGASRKLAEFKDAGFIMNYDGASVPVSMYVKTSSNQYYSIDSAMLDFRQGEVVLRFGEQINDTHNNYLTITNISEITITPNISRICVSNLG